MQSFRIRDSISHKLLVTRRSAHVIKRFLDTAVGAGDVEVALDFDDVEGFTPSFFDETLRVIGQRDQGRGKALKVVLKNVPANVSPRYLKLGRRHGLIMTSDNGTWVIARSAKAED